MYPLSTPHLQARQPQALHVQSHTLPRHEVHELVQLAVPQRRDVDPVRAVVQLQRRGAQVHGLEEGHYGGALKLQLQRLAQSDMLLKKSISSYRRRKIQKEQPSKNGLQGVRWGLFVRRCCLRLYLQHFW